MKNLQSQRPASKGRMFKEKGGTLSSGTDSANEGDHEAD